MRRFISERTFKEIERHRARKVDAEQPQGHDICGSETAAERWNEFTRLYGHRTAGRAAHWSY